MESKEKLDDLLEAYQAQPVGNGYIDIIVSRECYRPFAKTLIENGFIIEAISWWEYLDTIDESPVHGMGGPRSEFYPGWFSELGLVEDICSSSDPLSTLVEFVEGKIFGKHDGKLVSFRNTKSLTPAFWLRVDENWKNKHEEILKSASAGGPTRSRH